MCCQFRLVGFAPLCKSCRSVFFLLVVLVVAGVHAAPLLSGAGIPDAGALGNQLRQEASPSPAPPADVPLIQSTDSKTQQRLVDDHHTTVVVRKVVFTGTPPDYQGTTENDLHKQVAAFLNRPLTFSDLQSLTQQVTDLYRQDGLLVAQAILPPQTVKNGVLTIQVIPGRYAANQLNNATALKSAVVQRLIRTTTPEGEVVTRRQLVREALLLNEIPGVSAQVSLAAGDRQGTTRPQVTITPGKRYGGYVGLDNQGDPTTGRSRVMAGFYANELLGYGDQLRVDLLDAYENSDLFNGAIDYSALVSGYGTRVGANYSHLNYRYNLNGEGFNGYSDNWGLYINQPWIRTAEARVDIRLDAGQQLLTDRYPQAFALALSDGERNGRKQVNVGALSMLGSVATTPGGLSAFTLRGTVGDMDYRNATSEAFSGDNRKNVTGQFSRLNYQFSHEQSIWGPVSFYTSLNGQLASHNLDSSQKFLMGGPGAVRAYDVGDGSVDEGNVVTAEVRSDWSIPVLRWLGHDPKLTVAAFYDQGWGTQNKDNTNPVTQGRLTDKDNWFSLAGSGLYATVADAGNYALTLTWAHRTGDVDPVSNHDDTDRIWISAVKTF
ncbi:ShlB/FhaC/HecB family hemolysin secretion/activation protein [Salmonella enterica]